MKKLICIVLLAVFSFAAYATIYKGKDAQGNIKYSDQPFKGSKPADLGPPSVSHVPSAPSAKTQPDIKDKPLINGAEQAPEKKVVYSEFKILSPSNKQTFQNVRDIPVRLMTVPALQQGDRVQLLVNGSPYGGPQVADTLHIGQLDRGEHSVAAQIIDLNGKVLKTTSSVLIYAKFANLNNRPAPRLSPLRPAR